MVANSRFATFSSWAGAVNWMRSPGYSAHHDDLAATKVLKREKKIA
jgi:hypothetical protein